MPSDITDDMGRHFRTVVTKKNTAKNTKSYAFQIEYHILNERTGRYSVFRVYDFPIGNTPEECYLLAKERAREEEEQKHDGNIGSLVITSMGPIS
jgi:hypothetical protein